VQHHLRGPFEVGTKEDRSTSCSSCWGSTRPSAYTTAIVSRLRDLAWMGADWDASSLLGRPAAKRAALRRRDHLHALPRHIGLEAVQRWVSGRDIRRVPAFRRSAWASTSTTRSNAVLLESRRSRDKRGITGESSLRSRLALLWSCRLWGFSDAARRSSSRDSRGHGPIVSASRKMPFYPYSPWVTRGC